MYLANAATSSNQCPTNPPHTWSDDIKTTATTSTGTVTFTVETGYPYRLVATKDYYTCNTPATCVHTVFRLNPANITKDFLLNEPNLNQVVDLGCRVGNTTTQRPRNIDASRKVTENGVYWSPSYDYSNIVKWNRYFASDYHAWNFPQEASPAAPLPQANVGFSGLIFKLDQRCYLHTDPNECGANDYTNTELSAAAQTNPGSWWIMGEEPNKTSGPQTMTPSEYATWYHDKTQAILGGDRSAKFVLGYLAQYTPIGNAFRDPIQYTRDVLAQWKLLAAQNN